MHPWEMAIGFITIFLTMITGVWVLAGQFSACRQDIKHFNESITHEREDRIKGDDQLQHNVDKCKEDHSRRLQFLEEIHYQHGHRSASDESGT